MQSSDKLKLQSIFPRFHVLKSLFSHFPDFRPLNKEVCSASSRTDEARSVLLPAANGVHGHFSLGLWLGGFGSAGAGALSIPAWFHLLPWGSQAPALSGTGCLLSPCDSAVDAVVKPSFNIFLQNAD